MHSAFRYLIGFNGYPFSAVAAVALHCLVLGFIVYWNTASDSSEFELVQPTIIKSLFIDENPQTRERLERRQRQLQQEAEQRRQQEEADRQRELEEERLRQEEAERLREQQLERQRLLDEEERQRLIEEERRLQEERDAEERRRQEELAERERRRLAEEAELARAMEEAAAATSRTEREARDSGAALIKQLVEQVWSRPPSARNGMRAVLRVNMLPTGEVTDVVIERSSGDPAFDRSAENAVYRAQPFSELRQLPINVFNQDFRSFILEFQPEDLLN